MHGQHGQIKDMPFTRPWLKCNVTATVKTSTSLPKRNLQVLFKSSHCSPLSDAIHLLCFHRCNRGTTNVAGSDFFREIYITFGDTWGEDAEKIKSHSGYKRSCYHAIWIYTLYYIYWHIQDTILHMIMMAYKAYHIPIIYTYHIYICTQPQLPICHKEFRRCYGPVVLHRCIKAGDI